MTSLIFLLIGLAMVLVWRGNGSGGIAVFTIAGLLSVIWLRHHMTDPLALNF